MNTYYPSHLDLCRWQDAKVHGETIACGTAYGVPWEVRRGPRRYSPTGTYLGDTRVTVVLHPLKAEPWKGVYWIAGYPIDSEASVLDDRGQPWLLFGVFLEGEAITMAMKLCRAIETA